MDPLLRDLKYALRRLRKSPGFAAVVILTLALGIGANTAIFSVVNTVLLRPLAYRAPERLVTINHFYRSAQLNNLEAPVSAAGFREYREHTRSFESMAVETGWSVNLTGTGDPERLNGTRASGDYFHVLGVPAQLGRTLGEDDDVPGKNRVVVLSDGLWRRDFGGDPRAVGRMIELNDEAYQVVGVMPAGFPDFFNRSADIWTPLALTPDQFDPSQFGREWLNVVARLRPGVTLDQAKAEMTALADQLKRQYPNALGPEWTLSVHALDELATKSIRPALLVLLGAVGFVLLIACANVANLLLARAAVRIKEFAVRSALGADRWIIVRQLLAESIVLALAGGVLGLALAYVSVRSLVAAVPNLPRASEVGIDGHVMLFTLAVALVTGVLFGLAPALQTSRANLQSALREGGRSGAADFSGRLVRRGLVVGEVALALALLVGAGLLIRSVARLQRVDPGFDAEHLLTFTLSLPVVKYASDTTQVQFFEQALERIDNVPGVIAAGGTTTMPFGGGWTTGSFNIEGYTPAPNQPSPWGDIRSVTPDFFRTMRIAVRRGRVFTAADRAGSDPVAIIDDEMVKKYFHGGDAIGRHVYFGTNPDGTRRQATIVGVVAHTMHEGLDATPRIQLYLPFAQSGRPFLQIAVRGTGDPLALTSGVRQAIRAVDRDVPMADIRTMDDMVEASLGSRRLSMLLLGAFSAIALLLASLGIYGVLSYTVTQRAREMGIRMALGAARSRVLQLVIGQGMLLALLGIVIGLAASFGLTRLLASQLYAVKATDPTTFAVVALVLATIALLATLLPALRATRVDPAITLREE